MRCRWGRMAILSVLLLHVRVRNHLETFIRRGNSCGTTC